MAIETAKDRQARESIEALTRQLEEERAERERFENLFASTCETLGRVKRELGMPDAVIGTEPEQVATLRQERDAVQDQLCARIDELEMEKEALAAQLDRAETERDGLNEQLGKSERRAEYESKSFRILCHAIQRLEEIVGIDSGGYNGPGPALDMIERVVAERDALAARINRLVNAGDELADELEQWSLTEQHDETDAAFRSWRDARDQPAATSLARRDARMKAEALEDLLMRPDSSAVDTRQRAIDARDDYRRAAEGTSHD